MGLRAGRVERVGRAGEGQGDRITIGHGAGEGHVGKDQGMIRTIAVDRAENGDRDRVGLDFPRRTHRGDPGACHVAGLVDEFGQGDVGGIADVREVTRDAERHRRIITIPKAWRRAEAATVEEDVDRRTRNRDVQVSSFEADGQTVYIGIVGDNDNDVTLGFCDRADGQTTPRW